GVNRWLNHLGPPLRSSQLNRIVIHSIQNEVILRIAHAADAETGETSVVEGLYGASREQRQFFIVAAVEWNFNNPAVVDDLTLASLHGVQQRHRSRHFDLFANTADL